MEDFVPEVETVDVSEHKFEVLEKKIKKKEDIKAWMTSQAATTLMNFVMMLNEACYQKKTNDYPVSSLPPDSVVFKLVKMLEEMEEWIKDFPPLPQSQRFGNKAFRDWMGRVEERGDELVSKVLPDSFPSEGKGEVGRYLVEGMGNSTRIDYGTGHELAFLAFLASFYILRLVPKDHLPYLVFAVFTQYLQLVRNLQKTYVMEPAGSHGVWGLDDFQFLPFIWGSSQFLGHPIIKPKAIQSRELVESLCEENLLMDCIRFIHGMKRGPFMEHSPMLYDISMVPHWPKVNGGLHKMYANEVLAKFPIVQHFLFGSLFSLLPAKSPNPFLTAVDLTPK